MCVNFGVRIEVGDIVRVMGVGILKRKSGCDSGGMKTQGKIK